MSQILVINGNPKQRSFCGQLAEVYFSVAANNHDVRMCHMSDLAFNSSLDGGYDEEQALEPCLLAFQKDILWANHVVIVAPVWWGSIPAKLKGLLDRTLLPGFAFKYESGNPLPISLLQGKSLQLFLTLDTPVEYYLNEQKAPAVYQLDVCTFQYCGFEPAECHYIGPVSGSTEVSRTMWEAQVSRAVLL